MHQQLRKSKREYYDSRLNGLINNPKCFYKELNKFTGKATKNSNFVIKNDKNELITDDVDVAESFNKNFVSISKILAASIDNIPFTTHGIKTNEKSLFFYPADGTEISRIITNLKNHKSPGLDGLTAEILKKSHDVIVEKLSHLVNESLKSGTFPQVLKAASVVPIYKSGKKSIRENYRPISVLSVLSKVFERVVHERLYNFMDKNKLLYPRQFGFRSKLSPIHALSDITEMIRDNSNLDISCILLDLQKAFDTINHEFLLYKLEACGVRGVCLDWFTSYLRKRSQCVSINGKVSKPLLIDCGVPQGSILGPLLFIIYVNDFPTSRKNIIPFLFADDANCVYARPKNDSSTLQDEVEHIPGWMAMNKLSQIIPKTELVRFLNCKGESIVLKNTEITCTEYVKYLGIFLDKNLTYGFHVKRVLNKLAKHVSIINRLRHFTSSSVVIRYYKTYMKPIIQYGLLIYGCTRKSVLNDIFLVQKKILRITYFKNRRYPSDELFKRSEIMNVFDLYVFELLKFAVRSSRESQLHNIKSVFIHKNSLVFTGSVSSNMFYVPQARTQVSRQSLKYRGTVLLNHLLKTKLLPRNYESIGENETKRLILKIKNKISSERLADIVFC